MKAVILAGGFGTRISEESGIKTKTYGRDRRKTYLMAYNEELFSPWY
jgi:NDP-sugar pyrophosphorylase family protein